jgi:hypothetical protein
VLSLRLCRTSLRQHPCEALRLGFADGIDGPAIFKPKAVVVCRIALVAGGVGAENGDVLSAEPDFASGLASAGASFSTSMVNFSQLLPNPK